MLKSNSALVLIISLLLLAVGIFIGIQIAKPSALVSERIIIKTDTIYKTVIDSVPFKLIDTVEVKSKPVVIYLPSNSPIYLDSIKVETTKYTGKEELINGTIDYEIYADSLYATSFKLTTEEKTVINTITVTKTLPTKSRLFASGGVDLSTNTAIPQGGAVGLMYNRRQKWGIGAELRHDLTGNLPANQRTTVGMRVFIGF